MFHFIVIFFISHFYPQNSEKVLAKRLISFTLQKDNEKKVWLFYVEMFKRKAGDNPQKKTRRKFKRFLQAFFFLITFNENGFRGN